MFNIKISLEPYINLVTKNTKKEQKALVDKVNRRGSQRRLMHAAIASIVAVDFMSYATNKVAERQYLLSKVSRRGCYHHGHKTVEATIKAMLLKFYETSQFEEDPQAYKAEFATYVETLTRAYCMAADALVAEVLTLRDDAKALFAHTNDHWRNEGIIRSFTMFGPNEITRVEGVEYTVAQLIRWFEYQRSMEGASFKPIKFEDYEKEFGFTKAPDFNWVYILKDAKVLANIDTLATEKPDTIIVPYSYNPNVGFNNNEW